MIPTCLATWWAKHRISTHSIAAALVLLVVAYGQVPQFHDLVMYLYGLCSPVAQRVVVAAVAVFVWYHNGQRPQPPAEPGA